MGNFASSELNEWLIVIKDGQMIKSGIGLKTTINPFTETIAKFPSGVKKIEFSANQVSSWVVKSPVLVCLLVYCLYN